MKKDFYDNTILKLMAYRKRYQHHPVKYALKTGAYSIVWGLRSVFSEKKKIKKKQEGEPISIAFLISDMVGDVLISLFYLQEFKKSLPASCTLDVYCGLNEEVANGLLYRKNFIDNIYFKKYFEVSQYDLVVHLVRYPELLHFSERINLEEDGFIQRYVRTLTAFKANHPVFYFDSTWGDRVGIEYAILNGRKRQSQGDIDDMLGLRHASYALAVNEAYFSILHQNGLVPKKYLTFQRGVARAGEATRMWPLEHYEKLLSLLKNNMPDYLLVQLGRSDTEKINGIDIDLRGKTNFEELKNLLLHAAVHVDGDCGMVHLRHAIKGGSSVVLWGPTSPDFIGYSDNVNLRGEGCPSFCEWISNDWQQKCPRGFGSPPCLSTLSPEAVLRKIQLLTENTEKIVYL